MEHVLPQGLEPMAWHSGQMSVLRAGIHQGDAPDLLAGAFGNVSYSGIQRILDTWFKWEWSHRLLYLNLWSRVDRTVQEGLGGMDLLEKGYHWEWTWGSRSPHHSQSVLPRGCLSMSALGYSPSPACHTTLPATAVLPAALPLDYLSGTVSKLSVNTSFISCFGHDVTLQQQKRN